MVKKSHFSIVFSPCLTNKSQHARPRSTAAILFLTLLWWSSTQNTLRTPQFQGLKIDLCSYRRPNFFFRSAPVVRITKTNTILKRAVNKLFGVENTYNTKQTDKVSYKETASPFPCCSVNREYSWKKTQIEKKRILLYM